MNQLRPKQWRVQPSVFEVFCNTTRNNISKIMTALRMEEQNIMNIINHIFLHSKFRAGKVKFCSGGHDGTV